MSGHGVVFLVPESRVSNILPSSFTGLEAFVPVRTQELPRCHQSSQSMSINSGFWRYYFSLAHYNLNKSSSWSTGPPEVQSPAYTCRCFFHRRASDLQSAFARVCAAAKVPGRLTATECHKSLLGLDLGPPPTCLSTTNC